MGLCPARETPRSPGYFNQEESIIAKGGGTVQAGTPMAVQGESSGECFTGGTPFLFGPNIPSGAIRAGDPAQMNRVRATARSFWLGFVSYEN